MVNTLRPYVLFFTAFFGILSTVAAQTNNIGTRLVLNDSGYFETRGLNVMVFSNWYGMFGDEKMAGINIIHHGERTITNGDIRLHPTPEQWDAIPELAGRTVNKEQNFIEAKLRYPTYNFEYTIRTEPVDGGLVLSVSIDKPLPQELEGKAGFNLEFLPASYFKKTYMMDGKSGIFPVYPSGPMTTRKVDGSIPLPLVTSFPLPLATGKKLVLAPDDPTKLVTITSRQGEISLYDGRNKAQNGWYVVRTTIPSGKTGKVIEWFMQHSLVPNWTRKPVITHSQVGYHPEQKKVAVIELDKNDKPTGTARLLKISEDGRAIEQHKANTTNWGHYLRYNYVLFDFSSVKEPGVYVIEYGDVKTHPFQIGSHIYETTWHPTLDVYFPVQMDHMTVNEAYRIWHGSAHLDDALQAPVNHVHFDLYAQGPTTDTKYKPGEHIPGLNIGGWFDAGDFDIRTQTHYATVIELVQIWELFGLKRDETYVNQETRYVDIHVPDGKPDLLQQIEHGTLALIAQHRALGRAVHGIVEAHIHQYTHLGDAVTKTDNLIYNPNLDSLQSDGKTSGTFDDRWVFTTKTTPLNYGSIAGLAAASRALRGYNDKLADECLATAIKVWDEEHSHAPDIYYHGNTTGGPLDQEEMSAAVELLFATKDQKYAKRINEMWPNVEKTFMRFAELVVRVKPLMDKGYNKKLETQVKAYKAMLERFNKANPFGVPVTTGGWAGSGTVIGFANTNYILHKAYPEIIGTDAVFNGLNFIYGTHPGSDISFVSGVGTHSKLVAYGNNRADYSYIAGGIVPGVLIIPPDFPENREDWPFFWGENEYVINLGASYIFLVNAVNDLLNNPAAAPVPNKKK